MVKTNKFNEAENIAVVDKPKKAKRVAYNVPQGGLKAWPKDFDRKAHKPLRRKDFADETIFLEARLTRVNKVADRIREEIVLLKKFGGDSKKLKATKKVARLESKIKDMVADLTKDGVDIAGILAELNKTKK